MDGDERKMMDSVPSYFKYWGKTEKDTGRYHLLPYHCLDVAAVAAALWDASPAIRRAFRLNNSIPDEQLRAWLLFFIALHDYGKYEVRFQLRVKPICLFLYPEAESYSHLPSVLDCKKYYHGEGGLSWFMQDNAHIFGYESSATHGYDFLDNPEYQSTGQWDAWKPWIEAVTGHHGHIIPADYVTCTSLPFSCDKRLAQVDREARGAWLNILERMFLSPAGLSLTDSLPICSSIFLAGFCSVVDWLGSRCTENSFTFCHEPCDLEEYFEKRLSTDASQVLELAGIISHPRMSAGVEALLAPGNNPRSLQTLTDELPLLPGLTLMEAPTGSGKTEAAVAYAWRLIETGLADSIVFALPTQATANAMLGRLERLAPITFKEHPNLLLAHGSARFNEQFGKIKHSAVREYEEEDGWVQCSQWLAESRKRVFLGQIGVCTVDQTLISVLPVKHRFVRGFGIGRSVLIVDEIHAYDAYMYGLLEEVLRQQRETGGSAILLSATMTKDQRQQLCSAWGVAGEHHEDNAMPYPLITWVGEGVSAVFKPEPAQLPRDVTVKIEPIRTSGMMPDDFLLRRIVTAAEAGVQVALVCNLVAVAQESARKIREMTDLPVDLFHARYCFSHRREKELNAIGHFGPKGKREEGRILVATQVVEQSLDLDFDWLITQLCPVDLLFQRMGRLHRHDRPVRPSGFETPLCTVLLPEGDEYGLHEKIYSNSRVMWRTAKKLVSAIDGQVIFPTAYRDWIDAAYQEEPWDDEPEEITAAFDRFKDDVESVKKYLAKQMLERAKGMIPFADTDEIINAVTRDGEMNLTVIPFHRSAKGRVLMDGTVYDLLDECERLEALSLNSVGVPKSWGYWLENLDEGRYWLEMDKDGEGFRGNSNGVIFRYHKDMGLEKEK